MKLIKLCNDAVTCVIKVCKRLALSGVVAGPAKALPTESENRATVAAIDSSGFLNLYGLGKNILLSVYSYTTLATVQDPAIYGKF